MHVAAAAAAVETNSFLCLLAGFAGACAFSPQHDKKLHSWLSVLLQLFLSLWSFLWFAACKADLLDTGHKEELLATVLESNRMPRFITGLQKKLFSGCLDFAFDFKLQCFWHDVYLAKKLTAIVAIADKHHVSAEHVAGDMQQFSFFWEKQQARLEDICRQRSCFPSVFLTIAPAEWKFPLHVPVIAGWPLSQAQIFLTLHFYTCLKEGLEKLMRGEFPSATTGLGAITDWVFRFEFQSRGTLHVHVLVWAEIVKPAAELSGRTGKAHNSTLVKLLEDLFSSSVDVQITHTSQCLLQYVAGYVSKASDALPLAQTQDQGTSAWRHVYRLLSKSLPLWQELALELAGKHLIVSSFAGLHIHLILPGHGGRGKSGLLYQAYLRRTSGLDLAYFTWLRGHSVSVKNDMIDAVHVRRDNETLALSCFFPFELLDKFCAAWLVAFVPHQDSNEFVLPEKLAARLPIVTHFFWKLLSTYNGDFDHLCTVVGKDLHLRGLNADRCATFESHWNAKLLTCTSCFAWAHRSIRLGFLP